MLATLIRQVGDFQLAEDAVQDAFAAAVATWPRDGVPDSPRAWIIVDRPPQGDRPAAARAVDRRPRRPPGRAGPARRPGAPGRTPTTAPVADDRLRLIFTCCHPALALPARVALTLRTLGGLTTGEIARAFLVPEATMAQRLVRAKRKIADGPHPLPGAARRRAARAARPACWRSST